MHPQDQRLANRRAVKNMACYDCYCQGIFQTFVINDDTVVCPRDPTHTRHIRQTTALAQLRKQQRDAVTVMHNYPQLNPRPLRENSGQSTADLFGD